MKKISIIIWTAFASLLTISGCKSVSLTQAEQTARTAALVEKLNEKDFVFEAQDALPMGGRSISLTSFYSLEVKGDTLASTLPYFGRAFTAPMNPSQPAYFFDTNKFEYNVKQQDSDEWLVTITPKGRGTGDKFRLTAFNNGTASLQVTSNSRQPITFRGRIR